jgi:serine/threonine-protein kinase RsbW
MSDRKSFTMESTLDGLTELIREMNAVLEPRNYSDRSMYAVNLVVEEILTNTIKYGYGDDAVHRIEVRLELDHDRICIEFEDDGQAFDPHSIPPPQNDNSFADIEPGGLGLHLVRKMTDSMNYQRVQDRNIVTVVVRAS